MPSPQPYVQNPAPQNDRDLIEDGLVLPKEGCCFHCGEPLPTKPFVATVLQRPRQMCCLGCQLAAQSIVEANLEQYYLDRQKISRLADLPSQLDYSAYNHDDIKAQFSYQEGGYSVAELSVVGLRCAACVWLIQSRLAKIDGAGPCQINLTQQRMRVAWQENKTDIGSILQAINAIGYNAKPYRQDTHEAELARQNKSMLIRLGVAAIGAMQAMMFSIGLYFGESGSMALEHRDFLRLVAMVASAPVVFYAGWPFFRSAWQALRIRQVNMDVPVSAALVLTFFASVYAVWTKSGETYFDSAAMFVFFLLAGRYVEHRARLKAANLASDLLVVEPKLTRLFAKDDALLKRAQDPAAKNDAAFATRIDDYLKRLPTKSQSVAKVAAGDVVLVEAGEDLIADGILLSAHANVFQGLLTGEGELIPKRRFDKLLGGSQNDAASFFMIVSKAPEESQLALIDRLINRALSEKPKIVADADRMARWFVARVLTLAAVVFLAWWWINPSNALWATVAVLVATCPCALSLATPMALTIATNALAERHFLATRGHTIASLAQIRYAAFDKTGTLTSGAPVLQALHITNAAALRPCLKKDAANEKAAEDFCKAIAASLEIGSRHPMAKTLIAAAKGLHLPTASNKSQREGGGIQATVDDAVWRIGHADFAHGKDTKSAIAGDMQAVLSRKDGDAFVEVARFCFCDSVRPDAQATVDALKRRNITPIMLTGDPSANAKKIADDLGIISHTGLLPEDKAERICDLQKKGEAVLMVGDGINDAPVLARANVSVAMASGADLAQVASDAVLLGDRLTPIVDAIDCAKKTQRVIRQNLRWALFYNTAVIVPAALGYVPPWAAAIGMSLSSLLVALNALRIRRFCNHTRRSHDDFNGL